MNERQRTILGVMTTFALAFAGVLSFVVIDRSVKADVDTVAGVTESGFSYPQSGRSITNVALEVTNNTTCVAPGQTSIWRVKVENASSQVKDAALKLEASGVDEVVSLDEGSPALWECVEGVCAAVLPIGFLEGGQVLNFGFSGTVQASASQLVFTASLSENGGFSFSDLVVGDSDSVSKGC